MISDKSPILFLDINFGNNQISRIVLFEGDEPELVVEKFARAHGLDEQKKMKLIEIIEG